MTLNLNQLTFVSSEDFEYYSKHPKAVMINKKDSPVEETTFLSPLFHSIIHAFTKALSSFFSPKLDAIQRFYTINFSGKIKPIILFDESNQ